MQSFQRIAVTVVFTFTCFSVPVLAAQSAEAVAGVEKVVVEVPPPTVDRSVGGGVKALPGKGESLVLPGTIPGVGDETGGPGAGPGVDVGDRVIETPARPDWTGSLSSQIQLLKDQFRKEHQDLQKAYLEMLKRAKEVGKEERDKVREQFQLQREQMLEKQKELRDELKRRYQEFRIEHPEHRDLIDAAKERTKESIRERRGHGGE